MAMEFQVLLDWKAHMRFIDKALWNPTSLCMYDTHFKRYQHAIVQRGLLHFSAVCPTIHDNVVFYQIRPEAYIHTYIHFCYMHTYAYDIHV